MEKAKKFLNENKKRIIFLTGGIIALIFVVFIVANGSGQNKKVSSDTSKTKEEITTEDEVETETETIINDSEDPQPMNEIKDGVKVDIKELNAVANDFSVSGITYGIDVSKWQGKVNWEKVKASGIEFAMIRVGYRTEGNGTILEDSYAAYNLQKAIQAGVKVGVYFFSTAASTAEAKEEAAWVTNFISKYNITYPVVYNCEGYYISDSRMHGLSNTERTNNAVTFLDYVANKGYTPMFYGNSGELSGSRYWDTDTLTSKYKIWVAQYLETAFTSASKSVYSASHNIWQYTNKGKIPGISGYVDMNVAYFAYESVAKAKESGEIEEAKLPTQPSTQYDPYTNIVNEQVTAKIETNLRTKASTTDEGAIAYLLKNGEFIKRTAIGSNGWSKVEYNGQILYAKSSYLTTSTQLATQVEVEITTPAFDPFTDKRFKDVNEEVTAKEETNLRTVPNTLGNSPKYVLKKGEIATRTGIDENTGWSRVVYNGETLYGVSSLLVVSGE